MSGNTIGIILGLAAVVVGVFLFIQWQKKNARQEAQNRDIQNFTSVTIPFGPVHPNTNDFSLKSPAGVQIQSCFEVPLVAQMCIDQGIQRAIDDAPAAWTKQKDISKAWVFLIPADHLSVNTDPGAPLINVRQNIGTEQHPNISLISTAGTTVGFAVPGTSPLTGDILGGYAMQLSIVIPVNPDFSHLQMLRNACRNEYEHVLECGNDAQVAKQYLFASDVHPHRGEDMWNDPLPEVPGS